MRGSKYESGKFCTAVHLPHLRPKVGTTFGVPCCNIGTTTLVHLSLTLPLRVGGGILDCGVVPPGRPLRGPRRRRRRRRPPRTRSRQRATAACRTFLRREFREKEENVKAAIFFRQHCKHLTFFPNLCYGSLKNPVRDDG